MMISWRNHFDFFVALIQFALWSFLFENDLFRFCLSFQCIIYSFLWGSGCSCQIGFANLWVISWILRFSFWLESVRHLWIHCILGPLSPIVEPAARFIGNHWVMLVDLKTRKKEINATNSDLFHSSLLIVDGDSQGVVYRIFIEGDHALSNKHFAIIWW